MSTITPVTISYNSLVSKDASLSAQIKEAFDSSPESLGLLIVKDLPASFVQLRRRLLLLSNAFASLPEEIRENYTSPETSYSFGWSHGKEIMNGKPDTLKGSLYNNPSQDETPGLKAGDDPIKNIWPREKGIEGYEETFKEMCSLMVEIGSLVAAACDQLVGTDSATSKSVEELVRQSQSSKARLLHYFARPDSVFSLPPSTSISDSSSDEKIDDSWCGTHIDHSLLTVLCPSMYLFHPMEEKLSPLVIPSPSKSTGLFIKTRSGQVVQATIPEDCVALQTGETLELLTSQRLAATPHFVNATASSLGKRALEAIEKKKGEDESWKEVQTGTVTRETLAVFLQPNNDEVISKEGETFGQFTERVFQRHYDEAK
ncbi:uncharacterized protein JCM6883_004169 [Sporobolomyces salmoneus]|uniref:uncharacterized protein n=1 Tax=Sporobolomyces salmoneus TaxID=183962 RepID=UPI00317FD154